MKRFCTNYLTDGIHSVYLNELMPHAWHALEKLYRKWLFFLKKHLSKDRCFLSHRYMEKEIFLDSYKIGMENH